MKMADIFNGRHIENGWEIYGVGNYSESFIPRVFIQVQIFWESDISNFLIIYLSESVTHPSYIKLDRINYECLVRFLKLFVR